MLFEDKKRSSLEPARQNQPKFSYLNDSARPIVGLVRDKLEEFFAHYPHPHKSELMKRIQSRSDVQHESAVFELLLHEILLKMKCQVEVHPELDGSTTPDFLVREDDGKQWYLEAKLVTEMSTSEHGAESRLDDLLASIDSEGSSKYWLKVHYRGKPTRTLSGKKIRGTIIDWLETLDYSELLTKFKSNGLTTMPEKIFHFDGLVLGVSPIPKCSDEETKTFSRQIGITMSSLQASSTAADLRNAISKKATHYDGICKPYYIAINDVNSYVEPSDVLEALYGVQADHFAFSRDGHLSFTVPTNQNGALIHKNTSVTGCLIGSSVTIWNFASTTFELYLNPNARLDSPSALRRFPTIEIDLEGGDARRHSGLQLAEVLEVSKGWPTRISE